VSGTEHRNVGEDDAPDRDHSSTPAPATVTPGASSQTALGTITRWLREILPAEPTTDGRVAIDELFPSGREELTDYIRRFCALIALSASIAAFGLLADSGAVVIGAMLVAPLMTPIIAAAAATVTARNRRLLYALSVIVLGTALAIFVGWAMSLVVGGTVIDVRSLPDEIQSRTFPGLLDLGVAITAGAAAGYVQPRRSAISALPGVGIAVALVPPLATVGITLELGLTTEAGNAFLLYLTNLAAIVFSAGVVLVASGFRPHSTGRGMLRRRVAVTAIAVALVAIPLFRHTRAAIEDQRLESAVVGAVESWDDQVRIVELQAQVVDGVAEVEMVLVGLGDAEPAWVLAEQIRDRFDGPVELRMLYQGDELFRVSAR
jgi:uncharacterized hydrophobic protein (TIGR00271 family)